VVVGGVLLFFCVCVGVGISFCVVDAVVSCLMSVMAGGGSRGKPIGKPGRAAPHLRAHGFRAVDEAPNCLRTVGF